MRNYNLTLTLKRTRRMALAQSMALVVVFTQVEISTDFSSLFNQIC